MKWGVFLKNKFHETDLCVVGGGMAGILCAIAAARKGIKVVLMHDRPYLEEMRREKSVSQSVVPTVKTTEKPAF